MLFLPFFLLLFVSFHSSLSCELQDPSNITSSEQIYTTVKRRRSGAGGVKPPPWKPISIYTEYNQEIDKQFGKEDVRHLSNFVTRAMRRLKEMIKVQSPGEINVNLAGCEAGQGTKTIRMYDYAFFIVPKQCNGDTLATARSCHTEKLKADKATGMVYHSYDNEYSKTNNSNLADFTGRPVAGKVDICVSAFKNRKRTDGEKWVSTIMHEMTHAFVFAPHHYKNFLKRKGDSFEVYDKGQIGFKLPREQMYEIPGIVKKVMRDWKTKGGTIRHPVHLMITPEVTKQAREHFDCPTLEGGELENQGGPGSAMGHWEKRIYEHDTMGAVRTENNAFSKITLAVFADSGWYEVDYKKADPVAFGLKKGCKFVTTSCGEWVDSNSDSYPYCKSDDQRCSDDHVGIELCNAFGHVQDPNYKLTAEYEYFTLTTQSGKQKNGVPMAFADYCPYYSRFMLGDSSKGEEAKDTKCTSIVSKQSDDQKKSLQIFSNTARCFQIKKLDEGKGHVRLESSSKKTTLRMSHGCYEHKCEKDSLWVKTAKSKFYRCYYDGQEVKVNRRLIKDKEDTQFTIICPPCKAICGEKCKGRRSEAPERVGDNERKKTSLIDKILRRGSATSGTVLFSFVMMLLLHCSKK